SLTGQAGKPDLRAAPPTRRDARAGLLRRRGAGGRDGAGRGKLLGPGGGELLGPASPVLGGAAAVLGVGLPRVGGRGVAVAGGGGGAGGRGGLAEGLERLVHLAVAQLDGPLLDALVVGGDSAELAQLEAGLEHHLVLGGHELPALLLVGDEGAAVLVALEHAH